MAGEKRQPASCRRILAGVYVSPGPLLFASPALPFKNNMQKKDKKFWGKRFFWIFFKEGEGPGWPVFACGWRGDFSRGVFPFKKKRRVAPFVREGEHA